jgi:diguanylate cyclase (GGDEF)-like protein
MNTRSDKGVNGYFLSAITGLGLVTFAVLWELRWRRLVQTMSTRQDKTNEWVERALHDPLTSLPNRSLFNDRIEQALIRAQRNDTCIAVLFIDLDDFKNVNDRYGHLVGDQLLIAAGERFRHHLRASDTASRFGGDEFVVLLEVRSRRDPVIMVAERLRRALHVPLLLEPEPITLSASIGVAVSNSGEESIQDLLDAADSALLKAKRAGKDQVVLAQHETGVEMTELHRVERV